MPFQSVFRWEPKNHAIKIKISVIKVSLLVRSWVLKQTKTNQPKQAPLTKTCTHGHSVPVPHQVVWPAKIFNSHLWRPGDLKFIHYGFTEASSSPQLTKEYMIGSETGEEITESSSDNNQILGKDFLLEGNF